MKHDKIIEIETGMIAFATFLGGLFAMLYYIYQIKNISFIGAMIATEIYISAVLLFLYILTRWIK